MPIRYFAYGSNMLTERLKARCPTAAPIGIASVAGFALEFSKEGADGSAKATLATADIWKRPVFGVVYEMDETDLPALDRAEGNGYGYNRQNEFTVRASGELQQSVVTYLAHPDAVTQDLKPYDWYHGLVLAGARQHGLPGSYIEELIAVSSVVDPMPNRSARLHALDVLTAAGHL